jgi:glutathione peroxidase
MKNIYKSAFKGAAVGLGLLASSVMPSTVSAGEIEYYTFPSIYGGTIDTKQWQGKPYLVVNTASLCGFTKQYTGLQELYDKYREAGFGMVAVPSDDFNQELATDAEVKNFCELNYDINMPMTETMSVKGQKAHPFFKTVKAQSGFAPTWNFSKILIGSDGEVIGSWGPITKPLSGKITVLIEGELSKSN